MRVRRETGWRIERYPQIVVGAKDEEPDRRGALVKAALDIALVEGLDGLTLEAVAEKAGTSVEVVQRTIGGQDDVMLALLDWVLARTLDADRDIETPHAGPRQLGDMVSAEMEGLRRQAPVVELIFMFYFVRPDDRFRARIREALSNYRHSFESALEGVELQRGLTPRAMSTIVISFLQGAAVQIIRDPDNFDPTEAIAAARALLT